MRLTAVMLASSFAWGACSVASQSAPSSTAGPGASLQIEAGKNVSLKVGQSAQLGDGSLQLGFEGVAADSRCPKGEQCVRAGGNSAVRRACQGGTSGLGSACLMMPAHA